MAHYHLREYKPERQFHDGEFGVFTSDGDLWLCEFHRDNHTFRLLIGGTEDAPSEKLLAQARGILKHFNSVEKRAMDFLRSREAEVRAATLDFYCLEITNEQHPSDFTFEFIDPRDDSRAWRVSFVAGEPKETGFDD